MQEKVTLRKSTQKKKLFSIGTENHSKSGIKYLLRTEQSFPWIKCSGIGEEHHKLKISFLFNEKRNILKHFVIQWLWKGLILDGGNNTQNNVNFYLYLKSILIGIRTYLKGFLPDKSVRNVIFEEEIITKIKMSDIYWREMTLVSEPQIKNCLCLIHK